MAKLSKFDTGMIIAFAVVIVLGIAGWWYTGSLVVEAKDRIVSSNSTLQNLAKFQFTPDDKNIAILQANTKAYNDAVAPVLESKLAPPHSKLAAIKPMDPVSWKANVLNPALERMRKAAKDNSISIPDNFFFGFARFQSALPRDKDTEPLGKQLLAVEYAVNLLVANGGPPAIRAIKSVRRTFDEVERPVNAPSTTALAPEEITGTSVISGDGLYRAYPLEVTFTGRIDTMRKLLDGLASAPEVFAVRWVSIRNNKKDSPKLSDLNQMFPSTNPSPSTFPGAPAAPAKVPGPQFLFGDEDIDFVIRFDLIEWLGVKNMMAHLEEQKSRPAPPGAKGKPSAANKGSKP
jgi:hypothetical protein